MPDLRTYQQRGIASASRPAMIARAVDLRARVLAALFEAGAAGALSEALHEAVAGRHPSIRRRTKMLATLRAEGLVDSSGRAPTGHGVVWTITEAGRTEHAATSAKKAA